MQPREVGSGPRDDLGRCGVREGRPTGRGRVCTYRGLTLLCGGKEHGVAERLYRPPLFLKGCTPFRGLSRKSTPLPLLVSACRRLTLGSGPAPSTTLCASPPSSVLSNLLLPLLPRLRAHAVRLGSFPHLHVGGLAIFIPSIIVSFII